ncbi:hypothetical protein FBU30_002586 [Linnemannia zychae]|nr:hypothetical protein FBU30_002586 [Linnemannia zychae]
MSSSRKNKCISTTSTQAEKFDALLLPFKDPPDVLDLVKQIVVNDIDENESSSDSSSDAEEDEMAEGDGEDNSRYSGLRYKKDNSNQRNVFLACQFLSGRLPDLMFPDNNHAEKFSIARSSHSFRTLIKELRRQEPTLRQATALALHSMYDRVVKQYGKLDAVLKVETGGLYEYKLTQLAEYAKEIYDLHNEFIAQKTRTTEDRRLIKEREAEELETINSAAVQGSMLTLGERRNFDIGGVKPTSSKADSPKAAVAIKPSSNPSTMSSQTTLDTATRLSDMQHRLYAAFQLSNEKYDDVIEKLRILTEQVAALTKQPVIEDLENTLDLFHQNMAKMKTSSRLLGDEMIELRAEVREVKRKLGNVETDMTEAQKDIYCLKKKK